MIKRCALAAIILFWRRDTVYTDTHKNIVDCYQSSNNTAISHYTYLIRVAAGDFTYFLKFKRIQQMRKPWRLISRFSEKA